MLQAMHLRTTIIKATINFSFKGKTNQCNSHHNSSNHFVHLFHRRCSIHHHSSSRVNILTTIVKTIDVATTTAMATTMEVTMVEVSMEALITVVSIMGDSVTMVFRMDSIMEASIMAITMVSIKEMEVTTEEELLVIIVGLMEHVDTRANIARNRQ